MEKAGAVRFLWQILYPAATEHRRKLEKQNTSSVLLSFSEEVGIRDNIRLYILVKEACLILLCVLLLHQLVLLIPTPPEQAQINLITFGIFQSNSIYIHIHTHIHIYIQSLAIVMGFNLKLAPISLYVPETMEFLRASKYSTIHSLNSIPWLSHTTYATLSFGVKLLVGVYRFTPHLSQLGSF